MMRLFLILVFLTIIVKTGICQKPLLTDGNYLIVYESEKGDCYTLTIKDTTFIQYNKNDTISGSIVWLENSRFILKNNKKKQPQTEVEKWLESLGEICFEITSNKNNEYRFRTTHVGQTHITGSVGTIIKMETNEKIKDVPR